MLDHDPALGFIFAAITFVTLVPFNIVLPYSIVVSIRTSIKNALLNEKKSTGSISISDYGAILACLGAIPAVLIILFCILSSAFVERGLLAVIITSAKWSLIFAVPMAIVATISLIPAFFQCLFSEPRKSCIEPEPAPEPEPEVKYEFLKKDVTEEKALIEKLSEISFTDSFYEQTFKPRIVNLFKNKISCNDLILIDGLTWSELYVTIFIANRSKFISSCVSLENIKQNLRKYQIKKDIIIPEVPKYLKDNFGITKDTVINRAPESETEKQDWEEMTRYIKSCPLFLEDVKNSYSFSVLGDKTVQKYHKSSMRNVYMARESRLTFMFKDYWYLLTRWIKDYEAIRD